MATEYRQEKTNKVLTVAAKFETPYHIACIRCGSPAGRPCNSVGADAYARGAPLIRPHTERK